MPQCARCGASISGTTSRALKVHRLHCSKNVPMKFKAPTAQVPKVPQKHVDKSKVIFRMAFQPYKLIILFRILKLYVKMNKITE